MLETRKIQKIMFLICYLSKLNIVLPRNVNFGLRLKESNWYVQRKMHFLYSLYYVIAYIATIKRIVMKC